MGWRSVVINQPAKLKREHFALVIEQAGGRATTGHERVLDVVPASLHQKTPLICGSREEVDRVTRLYTGDNMKGERSALFGRRGLFRAMT